MNYSRGHKAFLFIFSSFHFFSSVSADSVLIDNPITPILSATVRPELPPTLKKNVTIGLHHLTVCKLFAYCRPSIVLVYALVHISFRIWTPRRRPSVSSGTTPSRECIIREACPQKRAGKKSAAHLTIQNHKPVVRRVRKKHRIDLAKELSAPIRNWRDTADSNWTVCAFQE